MFQVRNYTSAASINMNADPVEREDMPVGDRRTDYSPLRVPSLGKSRGEASETDQDGNEKMLKNSAFFQTLQVVIADAVNEAVSGAMLKIQTMLQNAFCSFQDAGRKNLLDMTVVASVN